MQVKYKSIKVLVIVALFISVLFVSPSICLVLLPGCSEDLAELESIATECKHGDFVVSIREKGVLQALKETLIKSPVSGKIARMCQEGAVVKEGDILLELDSTVLEQRVKDNKANLEIAKAELMKMEAYMARRENIYIDQVKREQAALEVARAELENAKAGLSILDSEKIKAKRSLDEAKINMKEQEHKLSMLTKLEELGIENPTQVQRQKTQKELAEISQEKAGIVLDDILAGLTEEEIRQLELKVELAEFRLKSAENRVEAIKKSNQRTLESYERRVKRAEKWLKDTQKELAATTIKSPASGLVLTKEKWGRKLAPGREVWKDLEVMSLPDLSKMKVVTFVEESLIKNVEEGQEAIVRVVSLPNETFHGRVSKVGTLPKDLLEDLGSSDRQKVMRQERRVFDVEIEIEESDPRLKPGLNVEVDIILEKYKNVNYIPKNAIKKRGKFYFASVLNENGLEERRVEIGPENDYYVVIKSGLEKGEKILID